MEKLLNLEHDFLQVTYVFIGGNNELRSKTKTLPKKIYKVSDLPEWNYDGSSTNQASGNYSEIIIKPQRIFLKYL